MNRFVAFVIGISVLAVGCSDSTSGPSQGTITTSTFTVPLSSANEVPPIVNADAGASGTATIALSVTRNNGGDISSATANIKIDVTGFPAGTTVTDAHVHNGGPGVNAGVFINAGLASGELVITNGGGSITRNGIGVPADRAAAMLNNPGGHYFNVHTARNPDGAIRGQLAGGGATFDPGTPTSY